MLGTITRQFHVRHSKVSELNIQIWLSLNTLEVVSVQDSRIAKFNSSWCRGWLGPLSSYWWIFNVVGTYLEALYVWGLSLMLSLMLLPFLTGVVGAEGTWWANRIPSRMLSLLNASANVALRHTNSSPCSRTRLSRSATRPATPLLSASNMSSEINIPSKF